MNKTKLLLLLTAITFFIFGLSSVFLKSSHTQKNENKETSWWEIQSIDTVKYSRDVAREKAKDISFDAVIDMQVKLISETGASHVAIGTPYAEEFVPFLSRWVFAARKYGLKVWFRGNVPGWEGWFGYPKIGRVEHTELIKEFILANGALFEEGDIFSSCPECENGGPGDPRRTRDIDGHRKFLIDEYRATNEAFRKIGKNIRSNFVPMNGDVANLIMDKSTTEALGGIVVIDHYVGTPRELAVDIKKVAKKSGGKVVLGEFGAPIPDIHGNLNEAEQAVWIEDALLAVSDIPELIGINYWTGFGGSTKLWDDDFRSRAGTGVISSFFNPRVIMGVVQDERGISVKEAMVSASSRKTTVSSKGEFSLPVLSEKVIITIQAQGYVTQQIENRGQDYIQIVLIKGKESILFKIQKFVYKISH